MNRILIAGLLLSGVLPAAAEGDRGSTGLVPVCDSLVALRQLAAGANEDRARAAAQISTQPGCRLVAQDQIGAVEQRTMFGGAAYECATLATGGCAWVMP